ncbi:MAG: hypothetical protein QXQ47_07205 [Candidatus Bathyarchaeia archaeon]
MKIEGAIAAALLVCIFLTFYFSLLPYQTADETAKVQFLTLSTIFLAIGVILFICLIFYHIIKKALSKNEQKATETKLSSASNGKTC